MARPTLVAGLALAVTAGALAGPAAQEPARRTAWASFIIFDMTGDGIVLTSQAAGVSFDLTGTGKPERVGWTAAGSDDALLVRDGDGNGLITSGAELLGKHFKLGNQGIASGVNTLVLNLQGISVGPDGTSTDPRFQPGQPVDEALGLGHFDKNDAEFARLRLWTDANHDGKSAPDELRTLPEAGVTMIGLGFRTFTRGPAAATGAHGNRKLFSGFFRLLNQGMEVQRELVEFEPTRTSTGSGPETVKPAPKPSRFRQLREDGTSEVLVVDLDGNGVCLTSAAEGVIADPASSRVMSSWTCARERDAFIVYDQRRDGSIRGEILGGILGPPQAFQHLEILATPSAGGQRSGAPPDAGRDVFDANDAQFAQLGLWIDENHDGQSDERELQSFSHAGLESIRLSITPAAETVKGNAITGRSLARLRSPRGPVDREIVSVRLAVMR